MQATHKTSLRTCNVLLSSILLRSNRITLQTPVYRVFNHAIWPIKTRHSHSLCSKIEFIRHLISVCLFWSGSLHCFYSCTPGIIHGPISSRCMGVALGWNYNGECMIKIFWRGGGGRSGDTFEKPLPPMNNFRLYPPSVLRCFWKDLLMTLHPLPPHFKHLSLLPPSSSTTPSPPIKMLIIH